MSDYTVIAKSINETLKKIGEPLTESQYMVLQGAIGSYLASIETMGMEIVLENVAMSLERDIHKAMS